MKKLICAASAAAAVLTLGSCGAQSTAGTDALINSIVDDVQSGQPSYPENGGASADAAAENAAELIMPDENFVNIDLTTMNSTMVYSVIYDIMNEPERYYGKSLQLDGFFDTMYDEKLDTRYYFVVVPDATACCAQGLEFIIDDASYPDDYPEVRDDIRVRGVIGKYEENGNEYCYIQADAVTKL